MGCAVDSAVSRRGSPGIVAANRGPRGAAPVLATSGSFIASRSHVHVHRRSTVAWRLVAALTVAVVAVAVFAGAGSATAVNSAPPASSFVRTCGVRLCLGKQTFVIHGATTYGLYGA